MTEPTWNSWDSLERLMEVANYGKLKSPTKNLNEGQELKLVRLKRLLAEGHIMEEEFNTLCREQGII